MATVLPNGRNYFASATGAPLVGGKLYTYVPGTSTPKVTYTTSAASVANANPVVLNSRGEANIYWVGAYDVVLKDASDVTIWGPERVEEPASDDAFDTFVADLADTSSAAKGDALVGFKRTAGSAVATTVHAWHEKQPIYAVAEYAAPIDGTTDARTALSAADTAAAGNALVLEAGTYKINSNLTIASTVIFMPGAVLKPANAVVVTLSKPPQAPIEQIFDISLGGKVNISFYGDVWADWWGAIADGTTDSAAAIQAASDMLIYPDPDGSGGVINFTPGTYVISTTITAKNRIIFRGQGFFSTEIKASAGFAATRMFEFFNPNGTNSQFGCRLEELSINCNDKSFSSGAVFAPSWNEHCGLYNVIIRNLGGGKAVYVTDFYGGSAQHLMENVEIVGGSSVAAGTVGIHLIADPSITLGWNAVQLRQISVTNAGTAANMIAFQFENRLLAYMEAIHVEDCGSGIYMLNESSATIHRLQGGPGCTYLIDISSSWTGKLTVTGFRIGNASKLVFDRRSAGYTRYESDDLPEPLIFPPDPGQVLAAARCTGGATPVISGGSAWAKRISGVSRNGVGSYRFTLSPGFGGAANIHAYAMSHETTFRAIRTVPQTATTFDVVFEDAGGSAVETTDFTVWVTHKP